MPTGTKIVTTFGLSDVAIALPAASAGATVTWYDLPSVRAQPLS